MKPVEVSIRRRRADRVPELFFWHAGELTCYAHVGQHSAADLGYYRSHTRPAEPSDPDCAALLAEWQAQPPADLPVRVVRRLKSSQPEEQQQ